MEWAVDPPLVFDVFDIGILNLNLLAYSVG